MMVEYFLTLYTGNKTLGLLRILTRNMSPSEKDFSIILPIHIVLKTTSKEAGRFLRG